MERKQKLNSSTANVIMDIIVKHTGVFFDLNFEIISKNKWKKSIKDRLTLNEYNTLIKMNNEDEYVLILSTDNSLSDFFVRKMVEADLEGEEKEDCKLAVLEEVLNTIVGNSTQELEEHKHEINLGIPETITDKQAEKLLKEKDKEVYVYDLKINLGVIKLSLFKNEA